MAAQSDLYNTFSSTNADRGDDRYFPLRAGNYLICISADRNEEFQYGVGLVVEFQTPNDELFFLCEDTSDTYLITENDLNEAVVEIVPIYCYQWHYLIVVKWFYRKPLYHC